MKDKTLVKVYVQEDEALYEVATVEDSFLKNDYTLLRQYKDIVLKLPLQEGTKWVLKDGAIRTITAIDQEEDTLVGKVKTIKVTTVHDDYKIEQFYAEKFGLVKWNYETTEEKVNMSLEKYVTNEPIKTYVQVYYPDIKNNKVSSVRQHIGILTNEETRHFLTDVLRLTPDENYVSPLPIEIDINSIYVEEDKDSIIVDLSNKYENYTAKEEKLATRGVVNTIGNYFRVNYVTMTVNGEPYKENIKVGR